MSGKILMVRLVVVWLIQISSTSPVSLMFSLLGEMDTIVGFIIP